METFNSGIYFQCSGITLYHGTCEEVMEEEDLYATACVSDPPYGLEFMGKGWDFGVPGEPVWLALSNCLPPGGMCLAFGGTRTFHRLTCGIEDAGFEIRDCMMWLYGSGFPKSHNISKAMLKGMEKELKKQGVEDIQWK